MNLRGRNRRNAVNLLVVGPKRVLPRGKIDILVDRNHTWYQALRKEGLELVPGDGAFVTTTAQRGQERRRAELNEKVSRLISKFKRDRARYTVHLRFSLARNTLSSTTSTATVESASSSSSSSTTTMFIGPGQGSSAPAAVGDTPSESNEPSTSNNYTPNIAVIQGKNQTTRQKISIKGPNRQNDHEVVSLDSSDDEEEEACIQQPTGYNCFVMPLPPAHNNNNNNYGGSAAHGSTAAPENFINLPANNAPTTTTSCDQGHTNNNISNDNIEFREQGINEQPIIYQQPFNWNNGGHYNDEMYPPAQGSIRTTASEEEFQLRAEGIEVEDLRAVVGERMQHFNNVYMLKVRKELESLSARRDRWLKFFTHAPLAVKMLEDVFVRRSSNEN